MIAVINMHVEIVDMLQLALEDEGFRSVGRTIPELERGDQSLLGFLDEHDPRVIIYDVSPPYPENWERFQTAREVQVFRGRTVMLTTTDHDSLERLIGPTESFVIFSKPFELGALLDAVREAVQQTDFEPD